MEMLLKLNVRRNLRIKIEMQMFFHIVRTVLQNTFRLSPNSKTTNQVGNDTSFTQGIFFIESHFS